MYVCQKKSFSIYCSIDSTKQSQIKLPKTFVRYIFPLRIAYHRHKVNTNVCSSSGIQLAYTIHKK